MLISVQFGDLSESFLPSAWECSNVGISCPKESGCVVNNYGTLNLKAVQRPRNAPKAFSILAATLATDLPTGCIVATGLASVQNMADIMLIQFMGHELKVLRRSLGARTTSTPARLPID
jgi:hypothetical protein